MFTPAKRLIMMGLMGYKNLVKNGSFELDTDTDGLADNWSKTLGITASLKDDSIYGSKSQRISSEYSGKYVGQVVPLITDHKYYVAVWGKIVQQQEAASIDLRTTDAAWNAITYLYKFKTKSNWTMKSKIFTALETEKGLIFRISGLPTTSIEGYFDGAMLVDLTEYGLTEKDLAWCDANIPQNIIW